MKRGEIWTVAGGPHYSSKPRPAVVLQADRYTELDSIVICLFTTDDTRAPSVRIPVFPAADNGLRFPSWLMIEKIAAVPRAKLGARIGLLDHATLVELSRAVTVFLDLSVDQPPAPTRRRR